MNDLYDLAPCGLVSMRRNGDVTATNATFREMVGPETSAGLGRFHDLLRIGDRIFWETHLGPLLDMQGHVREIAAEIGTDSGPLPVLLNATTDGPGDPAGLIHVAIFPARDRRSYEAELLAARRQAERSEARARLLAETLQESLMPPSVPEVPGLDVGAAYQPAGTGTDLGGDFYDFFRVSPSDWYVVMGDVCGKGAAAAAVAALVRYAIRGAVMETDDLSEALHAVNSALALEGTKQLCTAVVARLSAVPDGQIVTVAAAGHPLPRHVSPGGVVTAVGRHGLLLGAFDEAHHPLTRIRLRVGEALVFFTDGIVEARRGDEFFGEPALHELLAKSVGVPAAEVAQGLAAAAADHQEGAPPDDVAVVVVRAVPA